MKAIILFFSLLFVSCVANGSPTFSTVKEVCVIEYRFSKPKSIKINGQLYDLIPKNRLKNCSPANDPDCPVEKVYKRKEA